MRSWLIVTDSPLCEGYLLTEVSTSCIKKHLSLLNFELATGFRDLYFRLETYPPYNMWRYRSFNSGPSKVCDQDHVSQVLNSPGRGQKVIRDRFVGNHNPKWNGNAIDTEMTEQSVVQTVRSGTSGHITIVLKALSDLSLRGRHHGAAHSRTN